MTVCVAALCTDLIVMASDRQYTQDDHWKREPPFTKHFVFGKNAVALFSGSVAECFTMCLSAQKAMGGFSDTLDVKQIAEYLAEAFSEYRRTQAERGLLVPLGLTLHKLVTDTELSPSLVSRLVGEMRHWEMEDSFIVAGIDPGGLRHIYSVRDPGWATCEDTTGFVAVGSGADHASALFLRQNYNIGWNAARALFLAYSAKRFAEVDPFVGSHTDMYIVANEYARLHEELESKLQSVYSESAQRELQVAGETYERYESHVKEFLQAQQQAKPKLKEEESGDTGPQDEPSEEAGKS